MGPNRLFWRLLLFSLALVVGCVSAAALAGIQESHSLRWLLIIGILGVASLVAFVFIVRTVRPLEDLAQRVEALVAEHPQSDSLRTTRDEFSELASAFERMKQRTAERVMQAEMYAQQLSTVLENMMEGVLAVDSNERILFANHASRELLDASRIKLEGRPLLEITRNRAIHEAILQAFSQDRPPVVELQSTGPNRKSVALRARRLPGDPCPGVVAVLQDVTEIRRLENLRRDFVANVSHELKAPLASIKAYAETLRLGAIHDPDHNITFLARIEEEADRLHQLILDLLQLARVEAGKEAFEITELSLSQAARLSLARHFPAAESKQIKLLMDDVPEIHVRADWDGVETILDNLIRNAISYTPTGGRVSLCCRAEENIAVLDVEDTGIGIAPQHQDRIFERFYRVDRARSRDLGGTGLGLAIVKHLAQAFGGTVSVRSELGKGSTFTVRIPLA